MRHKLLTLVILAGLSGSAFAENNPHHRQRNGLRFFATGIEKTFASSLRWRPSKSICNKTRQHYDESRVKAQ